MNYQNRIKNRIPIFKTTEHQGINRKIGTSHSFYMNKPSEYLKHTIADPVIAPKFTASPDFSSDELMNLQQGDKWKYHPMFQHPMIAMPRGQDFWLGDAVQFTDSISSNHLLLIDQFMTKKTGMAYLMYARGFDVFSGNNFNENQIRRSSSSVKKFGVSAYKIDILADLLTTPVDKSSDVFDDEGCIFDKDSEAQLIVVKDHLDLRRSDLWFNRSFVEKFKRRKANNSLMKVVNVPMTMFSDDTSGNRSKQYNKYDSFLMVPAALPIEETHARESHYFICTSNKVLSAVEMLPPLVDDFCALEERIEMYSAQHGKYVLVVAPLLFISGDNPRHSQLAMHKGTSSSCYCRKCLMPTPANPNRRRKDNKVPLHPVVHEGHPPRTLVYLRQFNAAEDGSEERLLGDKLSFTKNGSEELLRLESFDPTLDTPAEMLHCIPLGVMRYLVTLMVKSNLLNASEKGRIQAFLTNYRISKAFSRSFRNELKHCGSFVGRDFKQLMQVLPMGLRILFGHNNNRLEPLVSSFVCLGRLAS
ncbi:hypothetical protein INT47_011127 [Mucor saturninus]|uniref:Uncharacterized protein n=1 Tax=Mucor saturninus TaxID=64648 RepID=A0A8H7V818_9FUNG|nr:hypothetical protein INT47_011127 [Mucor saturninus]